MNVKNPHAIDASRAGQAEPQLDIPLAYSISQFSAVTSVSRTLIYAEIQRGRLRLTKIGRRSLILVEDATAWLRGKSSQPAPSSAPAGAAR